MKEAREFHNHYGLHAPELLTHQEPELYRERLRRMQEEFEEVRVELQRLIYIRRFADAYPILLNLAKELADLRYTCDGTAVALGIDLDAVYAEVHRSNMTKEIPDDPLVKIQKGKHYEEADVEKALGYPIIDQEDRNEAV